MPAVHQQQIACHCWASVPARSLRGALGFPTFSWPDRTRRGWWDHPHRGRPGVDGAVRISPIKGIKWEIDPIYPIQAIQVEFVYVIHSDIEISPWIFVSPKYSVWICIQFKLYISIQSLQFFTDFILIPVAIVVMLRERCIGTHGKE